jgi:hypothetical protein
MPLINYQVVRSIKLLSPKLILVQIFFLILVSRGEVGATETQSCAKLLHPVESKVEATKGQGGIWGAFDQNYQISNHGKVTLKLDSKITTLIVRLQHLCRTQNGVPLEEIAQILLPRIKATGEKEVMEDLMNLGHFVEEAEELIAYVKSAENNLNRKLELNQIIKTIKESEILANSFVNIFKRIGAAGAEKIMTDSKALIDDIEKFLTTNPYLVLAYKETAKIPHSRYITGETDAM